MAQSVSLSAGQFTVTWLGITDLRYSTATPSSVSGRTWSVGGGRSPPEADQHVDIEDDNGREWDEERGGHEHTLVGLFVHHVAPNGAHHASSSVGQRKLLESLRIKKMNLTKRHLQGIFTSPLRSTFLATKYHHSSDGDAMLLLQFRENKSKSDGF